MSAHEVPGALAATPPGVADVLGGFCQHPSRDDYTLAGFDRRLQVLAQQQEQLLGADDDRGVFHLTYLSFSRQVRKAFADGRFTDPAWAADMTCRFVDAYLEQAHRWEQGDPSQCRSWRIAFQAAATGDANVLQAAFLGMNAHIHYDLAFVTLGACRAFGDLDTQATDWSSVTLSGVPDSRHHDFLVINRVAWESIPLIQDTVFGTFAPPLKWGNRLLGGMTADLGQRLLMDARDAAWAHTTLLIHARDEPARAAVAVMIDAYAASHTHLVSGISANPLTLAGSLRRWRGRRDAQMWGEEVLLPDTTRDRLLSMAETNPVVGELALRELAFAGYDPGPVVDALVEEGRTDLAGAFIRLVTRHAPASRREALQTYLSRAGTFQLVAVEQALADRQVPPEELPGPAMRSLHQRWEQGLLDVERCIRVQQVAGVDELVDALRAYQGRIRGLMARAGSRPRRRTAPPAPLTLAQAQAVLAVHPDPWVRTCAARLRSEGDEKMDQLIDRVLFLRTSPVFREVEAVALLSLAEELQPRSVAAGAVMVRAGQRCDGVHLITDGRVVVTRVHQGRPVQVDELGPGDAVGEQAVLADTPSTVECRARGPVSTMFVPTAVLARLLRQHPRITIGMARYLSQRLEDTSRLAAARLADPPG